MGSSVSLIMAKLLMEEFEIKVINSAPNILGYGLVMFMTIFHLKGRRQPSVPATHQFH